MAITRRGVILSGLAVGGGFVVYSVANMLDTGGDGDARLKFAGTTPDVVGINAWIKIFPDGHITFAVHRAEMGQGVTTSIPMMLAEELDADWSNISYEFPPGDKDYYNFGVMGRALPFGETEGRPMAEFGTNLMRRMFHARGDSLTLSSTSILDAHYTIRPAAAAARMMLVQAAAQRWGVGADGLVTKDSFVIDPASGERLGYGELAEAAAALAVPENIQPKDPADYRIVGRSMPRLDSPAKVNGSAEFSMDVRLPGMLYCAVVYSPVAGARINSYDASLAESMSGVKQILALGESALGVLAEDSWSALQAAETIEIEANILDAVTDSKLVNSAELFENYRTQLDAPEPSIFDEAGDIPTALAAANASITAVYEWPYLAHATMEPMNCTAWFHDGQLEIWAPSQALTTAQQVAARFSGLPIEQIVIHRVLLGGGYGRRAEMDFIERAVEAAMQLPGQPVKIFYSREEDIRNDMFRPAGVARLEASLDAVGRITSFNCDLVTQSVVADFATRTPTPQPSNAARDKTVAKMLYDFLYEVPNRRVAFSPQFPHVPVGYWRGTATTYGAFCAEVFMDELAEKAGMDPVEFRLLNLPADSPRKAVLQLAAEKAGWGNSLPPGRGRGVALYDKALTTLVQIVEVTVDVDGALSIDRIVCAVDPGQVINPDTVVAMMEGGMLYGVNAAVHGEITLQDGRVQQSNFHDYREWPIGRMPEVEVYLLPQGNRPEGVGETAVPGIAPAIANAIYNATGKRIRSLPIGERIDL
jgi:isoquinoline 1-oxidoreductase beta subunit